MRGARRPSQVVDDCAATSADEPMILRDRATGDGAAAPSATLTGWLLHVVRGPERGLVFPLGTGVITVGRGVNDALCLRDATVTHSEFAIEWNAIAQRHCLLPLRDDRVALNQRVLPLGRTAHELADGDQMEVRGTMLRILRTHGEEQ